MFEVDLMGAFGVVAAVVLAALQLAMVAAEAAIKPRRVILLIELVVVELLPICSGEESMMKVIVKRGKKNA